MKEQLPFPVSVRLWADLAERDRSFFCFQEDYLPLHPNHAAQIGLLAAPDGARVASWAYASMPDGFPDRKGERYPHETVLNIYNAWKDADRRAEVRRWLFDRGVPFRRTVYLMYEHDRVVRTTWRMVVRYWDAFAWSVGYAMDVVDHTLQWACCFHHESVIVFGSHDSMRRSRRN